MATIIIDGLEEADLRVALWKSNSGHTKKSICEYLKIKYNPARLTKILTQFQEALARDAELRKAARGKKFTEEEKDQVVKRYLEVNSMAKVAEEFYVSSAKIKNILVEKQVPIKSRKTVLVDHIKQDLNVPFNVGEIVFSKIHKNKCVIKHRYDEDYIEYLQNGFIKTVDNPYVEVKNGEELENVNFTAYWVLEDGTNMGLVSSVESTIKSIELNLIKEGQEFYKIQVQSGDGDDYFAFCKRGDLYKV